MERKQKQKPKTHKPHVHQNWKGLKKDTQTACSPKLERTEKENGKHTKLGKEAASSELCDTLAINNQPRTVELGLLASQASLRKLGPQPGMLRMLLGREEVHDVHLLPLESTTPADNEGSLTGGGHSEMNRCGGRRPNDVGVNHSDHQAPELNTQEPLHGVPNHLGTIG